MRHFQQDPFRTWLVTPNGNVKTVYFHGNVQSPLLDVGYHRVNGRVMGITFVRASGAASSEGYSMLEDLYREEGREGEWEAFLDYQRNIQAMDIVQHFPDEMLPKEVLSRRKDYVKRQWVPPGSQKKEKSGAAKA